MQLTYTPREGDSDTVTVDGITFTANVPVDVPDGKDALFQKLSSNPWFMVGAPTPAWVEAHDPRIAELKHEEALIESGLK